MIRTAAVVIALVLTAGTALADSQVIVRRAGVSIDLGRVDDLAAGQVIVTKTVRDGDERIVGTGLVAEIILSPLIALDYTARSIDFGIADPAFHVAVVTPAAAVDLGTVAQILDGLADTTILSSGRIVAHGDFLMRAMTSCRSERRFVSFKQPKN